VRETFPALFGTEGIEEAKKLRALSAHMRLRALTDSTASV
jgi:hypothetical protein